MKSNTDCQKRIPTYLKKKYSNDKGEYKINAPIEFWKRDARHGTF